MKLEVGKTYRTRGGRKVRVICIDRDCDECPVIALLAAGDVEEIKEYAPDGSYVFGEESDSDLVAEHREPLVKWLVLNKYDSTIISFEDESAANRFAVRQTEPCRVTKFVEVIE